MRLNLTTHSSIRWNIDYDPITRRLNTNSVDVGDRIGEVFFYGGHTFLRAPGELFVSSLTSAPNRFSQYYGLLGYGHPDKKGFSAAVMASTPSDASELEGLIGNMKQDLANMAAGPMLVELLDGAA